MWWFYVQKLTINPKLNFGFRNIFNEIPKKGSINLFLECKCFNINIFTLKSISITKIDPKTLMFD